MQQLKIMMQLQRGDREIKMQKKERSNLKDVWRGREGEATRKQTLPINVVDIQHSDPEVKNVEAKNLVDKASMAAGLKTTMSWAARKMKFHLLGGAEYRLERAKLVTDHEEAEPAFVLFART